MIHTDTIALAARLAQPIRTLDALIVPVASGARDSNGQPYGDDAGWRRRLAEVLVWAKSSIESAQQELAREG